MSIYSDNYYYCDHSNLKSYDDQNHYYSLHCLNMSYYYLNCYLHLSAYYFDHYYLHTHFDLIVQIHFCCLTYNSLVSKKSCQHMLPYLYYCCFESSSHHRLCLMTYNLLFLSSYYLLSQLYCYLLDVIILNLLMWLNAISWIIKYDQNFYRLANSLYNQSNYYYFKLFFSPDWKKEYNSLVYLIANKQMQVLKIPLLIEHILKSASICPFKHPSYTSSSISAMLTYSTLLNYHKNTFQSTPVFTFTFTYLYHFRIYDLLLRLHYYSGHRAF